MPRKPITAPTVRQIKGEEPARQAGRTVASNGYVLIRVGTDHQMADVRGYAYEHRLVMARMIGRMLLPEEQVHHRDHDKQNNDPGNLGLAANFAEHRAMHRIRDSRRRLPGEGNPEVMCECGCGSEFPKYDEGGRPRRFVPGHNPQEAPASGEILEILARLGPLSPRELISLTGKTKSQIMSLIARLHRCEMIRRTKRGIYEVVNHG